MMRLNHVDEHPLPGWAKASDGRMVEIDHSPELIAEYEAWRAAACRHPTTLIIMRVNAGGAKMYNRFCKHCALSLSSQLKHEDVTDSHESTVEYVEAKNAKYTDARYAEFQRIILAAADLQQPAHRREYADYLNSDHWKALRTLVMDRANGVCEGCLDRTAQDVHHRTYANIGSEFAFDLLALCNDCHVRLHSKT